MSSRVTSCDKGSAIAFPRRFKSENPADYNTAPTAHHEGGARHKNILPCADGSVPRAVTSESPSISPFRKPRSLPLAVLTRRSSAQGKIFCPPCRKSPPNSALLDESKKRRLSQLKLKPKGAGNYENQDERERRRLYESQPNSGSRSEGQERRQSWHHHSFP